MNAYVYPRQRQDMRVRTLTLVAGLGVVSVGVIVGSFVAGALGASLLVAGGLLFVRELRLVRAAMSAPLTEAGNTAHSQIDTTLDRLLALPEVAEAWKAAPERFAQVGFLDHVPDGDWPKADVPQYVYISKVDDEWSVAVGDELYANLDLDVDPGDDPMCRMLMADPRVLEVRHSNREEYTAKASDEMTTESFAVLAVRGLVAHHLQARTRFLDG